MLEEIGEAVIKFFNNLFYNLISMLINIIKKLNFYRYFERRNVELKDYIILKVQIATVIFLVISVLFVFNFLSLKFFSVAALLTGGYSILLIFSLKEHFENFRAYRDFFFSYLGVSVSLVLVKLIKPAVGFSFPYIHMVLFSLVYITIFSYLFKKKYARSHTLGRVIEEGSQIKVKVNYDICADVKPGIFIFENKIGAKKGDVVKLAVEKGFLNLSGSKVTEILGRE